MGMPMVKKNNWLIEGMTEEKLQTEKALAVIGAEIYLKRNDLGIDQKEFAKMMGVSQGLISRWESGKHNFTISTLSKICSKLNMQLNFNKIIVDKQKSEIIQFVPILNSDAELNHWTPTKVILEKGGVA